MLSPQQWLKVLVETKTSTFNHVFPGVDESLWQATLAFDFFFL